MIVIFLTIDRGHGTFTVDNTICSSLAGITERVNRLVSVKALKSRYAGNIGDVVIGRILEIGSKRWRVDCNSRQDAALLLSSIHLPGAIQRRRSESDELQMRSFFAECEVVVAEVQTIYHDGALGIHTRSLKYGKLVTGELITVHSSLIQRSRTHFFVFSWNVEVILGLNGFVWVGKPRQTPAEQNLEEIYSSKLDEKLTKTDREAIARTRNCIICLDKCFRSISQESILRAYELSQSLSVSDILLDSSLPTICPIE